MKNNKHEIKGLPEKFIVKCKSEECVNELAAIYAEKNPRFQFSKWNYVIVDPDVDEKWEIFDYLPPQRLHLPQFDFESWRALYYYKEKEIIGYKLVKPEYEDAACKIAGVLGLKLLPQGFSIAVDSAPVKSLQKAGVLDLWFEPVYKEEKQFQEGDWVYVRGIGTGNGILDKDFTVVKLLNAKERTHGGNIYPDFAFRYKSSIYGIRKEFIIRKATPEEIKAATERYVDLSIGKTVFVKTDEITAEGRIIEYRYIKNLYCNTNTFGCMGWTIQYNSFDIGCWKNITRDDLKLIIDAYDEINLIKNI